MPSISVRSLRQKAVLLTQKSFDKYGEATTNTAIEINVRWEESIIEPATEDKPTKMTTIEVYVDRLIELGSYLWKGELADLPGSPEYMQVIGYEEIPDVKGKRPTRIVTLKRL